MEINELINTESTTIVDVRSPAEFSSGHVEGSLNIPLDEMQPRLEEFKNMSKPIILCCASGGRSEIAFDLLVKNEFKEVYNGGGWHQVQIHKM